MSWIVVQTKSNCEIKATVNLVRQGYEVFFPKIKKTIRRFNKLNMTFKPLFPGYIFVSMKKNQSWTKINYTYGVFKILKFGQYLNILPIVILNNIKQRCDKNGYYKNCKNFIKGEEVKFYSDGNIKFDAIFDEHIDQKRSYVLIEFLKQKVRSRVLTEKLEVIF